ncbi:MAG: phosphatidylserine/phosphatidylglycerophosphate/cardiolipin synthase family protein [Verrucomicrobiales bacterium]
MLKDRTYALIRGVSPEVTSNNKAAKLPDQAGGPEFEAYLDQQGLPEMTSGSVEYFVDGKAYFQELLRELEAAKSRVDIQSYIFDNDPFAVRVADALKKKSLEVPVRVYFDALGSELAGRKNPPALEEEPPSDTVIHRYLKKDSNVRVRRFLNPWLIGDHSKLHIIDQRIAYVGGMNIGWEYHHDWHDMMLRMEGPVVEELADKFESRWRSEDWMRNWGLKWTGSPERVRPPEDRDDLEDFPLRVLMTHTSRGKREILKATSIAIRSASKRVWIQTPYFTSDNITMELENAVRRGVDVRVVVPGDNDTGIMDTVNAASLEPLAKAGGKIYAYPGMTHLKAAVFDDWATFGSSNYDTLSLRINRELNLASSHPKVVDGLVQKIFLPDFRRSRLMPPEELSSESSGPAAKIAGDQL